jgi:predicted peptidase
MRSQGIKNHLQDFKSGVYLNSGYVVNNDTLLYRILYPNNFNVNKSYPILFFLHGSGERGNDNEKQLTHGGQLFLDSIEKYPAIIIFPQCPENDYWASVSKTGSYEDKNLKFDFQDIQSPTKIMTLLEKFIDHYTNKSFVDKSRIYIAGLSMGGMGTAQLLAKRPNFFAAGTVICGVAPLNFAKELTKTPTSIYHGDADPVVSVEYGENYFKSIDNGTSKHRIKIYNGVDHESWNNAFREPDFLSWIFNHTKNL